MLAQNAIFTEIVAVSQY